MLVKKEVNRVKNLTIDRVWVNKEVKMGQNLTMKKEVLPKMGQKEVKKGLRSTGVVNVKGKSSTLKGCCYVVSVCVKHFNSLQCLVR